MNGRNDSGTTMLMEAVIYGPVGAAALLVEKGADITPCDNTGRTALDYALRADDQEVIDLLLCHMAKIESVEKKEIMHARAVQRHDLLRARAPKLLIKPASNTGGFDAG